MSEELLAKWLEDRTSLTDGESDELRAHLESDPESGQRAKDQLALDDLLSRRFAVDRAQFRTQVAQRVLNVGGEGDFVESTLKALKRVESRGRAWRAWAAEAAAAAVLVAGLLFLLMRRTPEAPTIVAPAAPGSVQGAGLKGDYFQNQHLKGRAAYTRTDAALDFDWPARTGPVAGWKEVFSARWTGKIRPRYSERYTFRTRNDDGVRVWIDGKKVIDDWTGRYQVAENRGAIELEADRFYDIKVEYFNGGDLGVLKLYWSSSRQTEEIVPSTRLSHE